MVHWNCDRELAYCRGGREWSHDLLYHMLAHVCQSGLQLALESYSPAMITDMNHTNYDTGCHFVQAGEKL